MNMKHFIVAIVTLCTILSCSKRAKENIPAFADGDGFKQVNILQSPLKVPETNIVLPKGSKIYIDDAATEIRVELPEGYAFFTNQRISPDNVSKKVLPYINLGSYTCECSSKEGRCSVFHLSVGGFGCLHNSCEGTCTGKFITPENFLIEGVIDYSAGSTNVAPRSTDKQASLSGQGKQHFFDNPVVQKAVLATYQSLYKNSAAPDLESILADTRLQQEYAYAKYALYGVDFYLIVPRKTLEHVPEVELIDIAEGKCSCSKPGVGNCRKEKRSLIGIVTVYWCEGDCTSCVLSM